MIHKITTLHTLALLITITTSPLFGMVEGVKRSARQAHVQNLFNAVKGYDTVSMHASFNVLKERGVHFTRLMSEQNDNLFDVILTYGNAAALQRVLSENKEVKEGIARNLHVFCNMFLSPENCSNDYLPFCRMFFNTFVDRQDKDGDGLLSCIINKLPCDMTPALKEELLARKDTSDDPLSMHGIVWYLMRAGADVNQKNRKHETALTLVHKKGFTEIASFFEKYGKNQEAKERLKAEHISRDPELKRSAESKNIPAKEPSLTPLSAGFSDASTFVTIGTSNQMQPLQEHRPISPDVSHLSSSLIPSMASTDISACAGLSPIASNAASPVFNQSSKPAQVTPKGEKREHKGTNPAMNQAQEMQQAHAAAEQKKQAKEQKIAAERVRKQEATKKEKAAQEAKKKADAVRKTIKEAEKKQRYAQVLAEQERKQLADEQARAQQEEAQRQSEEKSRREQERARQEDAIIQAEQEKKRLAEEERVRKAQEDIQREQEVKGKQEAAYVDADRAERVAELAHKKAVREQAAAAQKKQNDAQREEEVKGKQEPHVAVEVTAVASREVAAQEQELKEYVRHMLARSFSRGCTTEQAIIMRRAKEGALCNYLEGALTNLLRKKAAAFKALSSPERDRLLESALKLLIATAIMQGDDAALVQCSLYVLDTIVDSTSSQFFVWLAWAVNEARSWGREKTGELLNSLYTARYDEAYTAYDDNLAQSFAEITTDPVMFSEEESFADEKSLMSAASSTAQAAEIVAEKDIIQALGNRKEDLHRRLEEEYALACEQESHGLPLTREQQLVIGATLTSSLVEKAAKTKDFILKRCLIELLGVDPSVVAQAY